MPASGRRLSIRHRLTHPVEASLGLCRGGRAHGWIVNEQDDGIGMVFAAQDVARMLGHAECCLQGPVDLWIGADGPPTVRAVPMRLAHVTPRDGGPCLAGLAFDVARMQPEDVVHLLGIWRRFVVASELKRTV
jgi:hypothetical protein